ncbi:MAG: hypothetical protein JRI23_08085 [Deltaproteobacteria bacterium]|nr:hypothetical protein [Deltaproteobacteria bacterium]MBW2531571.1 hypothetical protein [Deltaproteobacteria bacterium]
MNHILRHSLRIMPLLLALLGLLLGCDDADKKPAVTSTAAATEKPKAKVAPSGGIADLQAPPEVVAFGGTESFQKLITDVGKLAGSMAPGAVPPPAMLTKELSTMLKLKNADAVDFSKTARFVLLDPKKHDNPLALILGTKGKDQMVASLPDDKKEKDEGNAYSWTTQSGKTAYLNFIDDFAVVSPSKDIFPSNKAFIEKVLGAKLPAPVAIVGSMVNVMKLYGTDLDQGINQAKEQMKQGAAAAPGGAGAQAAQMQSVGAMFDWFADTMKELDKVVLTGRIPEDGALVSLKLYPKKGTELEKVFKLLGKRPLDLLAKLPADSPAFFAMNLDPDKAGDLTKKLVQWSLTMGMGGQEVPEKYVQGMSDYWKATNGQFVLAAHKALEGEGMSLTGLMGLRDADKARASMKLIAEMYKEPSVSETYKKMGMTIEYKDEAYKIGDVPVATQQVKFDKSMAALGPMAPMLADLMYTHTAMAEDLGYIAYGKDAKSGLEAFMGGKVAGGLDKAPGVVRAMKNAAPGTFFLFYAEPVDVAKGIHLGGQNPLKQQLAGVPESTTGMCVSGGAKDGIVDVTFDVPTSEAKSVMQVVMMLQGAAMGMAPGAPGAPGQPGMPTPAAPAIK